MPETKIYSKNSTFQRFQVLKTNRNKRYRYNEFLVEGVRSLNEAVKNSWKIKSFLYDKNKLSDWAAGMIRNVSTDMNYCLTPELMSELSSKEDTSELMAVIEMRQDSLDNISLSDNPFIVLFEYISGLKEKYPGFITLGTTAHKEYPIYSADLTLPLMLMMGNETMGLNKAFKEYCDLLCTIPMSEKSYASSFNVSCAASILMYEVTRQRGIK